MRISRLELDGIGPFDNAEFDFPPPEPGSPGETVLFEGPNGSGKTTIMLSIALALLKSMKRNVFETALDEGPILDKFPFLMSKRASKNAKINVVFEDNKNSIAWGYNAPKWKQLQLNDTARMINPVSEKVENFLNAIKENGTTEWAVYTFASRKNTPVMSVRGPAPIQAQYLKNTLFFSTDPTISELEKIQNKILKDYSDEQIQDGPPLGQLLSNFDYERSRAVAYGLKNSSESQRTKYDALASSYEEALERMQKVLSDVMDREVVFDFRIGEPAPRVLFDKQEIPLEILGEGLRNTFSWLSDLLIQLFLTPWKNKTRSPLDQDFWLLLDEVDQSLHPQMQLRLIPALRRLFKNARIYATTHSPFVVASAGHGRVFTIAPDRKTHRVSGAQTTVKLEPGQTLERIVAEVFDSPSLFIDEETRNQIAEHEKNVLALRKGKIIDWEKFLEIRNWLMDRTEEVRAVVAMREVPIKKIIETRLNGDNA